MQQTTRIRVADDSDPCSRRLGSVQQTTRKTSVSCALQLTPWVCWGREEIPAKGDAISQQLKAKCQRVIDRNRQEQPTAAAAAK